MTSESETRASEYDDLRAQIQDLKIKQIRTEGEQALAIERAVMAKERELITRYEEKLRTVVAENDRLQMLVEQLQAQITQLAKVKREEGK